MLTRLRIALLHTSRFVVHMTFTALATPVFCLLVVRINNAIAKVAANELPEFHFRISEVIYLFHRLTHITLPAGLIFTSVKFYTAWPRWLKNERLANGLLCSIVIGVPHTLVILSRSIGDQHSLQLRPILFVPLSGLFTGLIIPKTEDISRKLIFGSKYERD